MHSGAAPSSQSGFPSQEEHNNNNNNNVGKEQRVRQAGVDGGMWLFVQKRRSSAGLKWCINYNDEGDEWVE